MLRRLLLITTAVMLTAVACKKSPTGPAASELTLTAALDSLYPGDSLILAVVVKDADGVVVTNPTVTWTSSSNSAATVSNAGVVRAVAGGNATITAKSGGKSATVVVKVVAFTHPAITLASSISLSGTPYGVTVANNGTFYVSRFNANGVNRGTLAGNSQSIGTSTGVGILPASVAIDPAGTTAYTANQDGTSSVVSVATDAVVGTITLSDAANNVLVSPDGKRVFVTTVAGKVHFIDAATRTILMAVQIGGGASGLAYSTVNNRLYASSINTGTIAAIDPATFGVTRTYTVGGSAQRIAVTRDGTKLYVASEAVGLQEVDVASGAVTNRPDAGPGAVGLALSPDEDQVWVTNPPAGKVLIIKRSTGELVDVVFGIRPRNVTFDRKGSVALITDEGGQVIFVR